MHLGGRIILVSGWLNGGVVLPAAFAVCAGGVCLFSAGLYEARLKSWHLVLALKMPGIPSRAMVFGYSWP